MCGIAGYFCIEKGAEPLDSQELVKLRDRMHSRGPDAEGIWISEDRNLGLAHRRLSILDPREGANQPFVDPGNRGVVLVFNGEIYNYRELRERLKAKGHTFQTDSDTEVLLSLYLEYGEDCVEHLRGMYAFALWDSREEALLLARDPFGMKPLYYTVNQGRFHFASQVRPLAECCGLQSQQDPVGAVGFFLLGFIPDPYTPYKGIRQLPAGHILKVRRGRALEQRGFCNAVDLWRENESDSYDKEAQRVQLKEALIESIDLHLVSDVPIGFFLSAGLDSTSITSLAHELGRGTLKTMTLGFEEYLGDQRNEVPVAEEVAAALSTEHTTKLISQSDFSGVLDHFFKAMDQPTIDGLNVFLVSQVAKDAGLTVALSGLGGDELFGGYPSFDQIPKIVGMNRWSPSPNIGRYFRMISEPIIRHFTSPKFAGVFEYGGSYEGAYLLRRGLFMPWELPSVLEPELIKEGWPIFQELFLSDELTKPMGSPFRSVAALEMSWYMRDQLLRVNDWAGMAHSLEIRVPFVDLGVLETVSKITSERSPLEKLDMTTHLRTPLPPSVLQRRKSPFAVPIRDWLSESFPELDLRRHGLRAWGKKVWESYWN